MPHRVLIAIAILALVVAAPAALAQPRSLTPQQLDALFTTEPRVEVNVSGALLNLVAELAGRDEPEFATMLRQLRGVYVRQYPLSAARAGVADRVNQLARGLERDGWEVLVRVREPEQNVFIYHRVAGSALDGLVVMVLEEGQDEATFVTIDGRIDPAQIGRLGRQFNVPALEQASASR